MPTLERLDVTALRDLLTAFRQAVGSHTDVLNLLNVYPVPDGDTGTNMARTLDAVVDAMAAADAGLDATCDAISHGSLMGARGNSGVILSQILRAIATTFKGAGATGADAGRRFADALTAAAAGAYSAVLKPVEGTILTVVRESAEAASAAAEAGEPLAGVVEAAQSAGKASLDRTPELLPALADAGVVDAGGAGFLLFLDAALHVVAGRPLPTPAAVAGPVWDTAPSSVATAGQGDTGRGDQAARGPVVSGVGGPLDVSEQRYEVMYFLEVDDARIDEVKTGWAAIGDSIVVVGGDGLWNCHVHTNDVGAAIEVALDAGGRPRQIRVTDLFDEVADEHAQRDAAIGRDAPAATCDVVAVASGDGIAALFGELGVGAVVAGGQTANPSTAELLAAVERVAASSVIVLPNNGNIIAVAEQVDGLTEKSVRVVPTRSMPQALATLVVFDPDATVEVNHEQMSATAASVVSGEVTRAVRSSECAVGPVSEGDWIGLVPGEGIVSIADTVQAAATMLLDRLIGADHEIVTIVAGADADPEVTAVIEGWLADGHADVEVEVHEGGQPLYPYLFGVE